MRNRAIVTRAHKYAAPARTRLNYSQLNTSAPAQLTSERPRHLQQHITQPGTAACARGSSAIPFTCANSATLFISFTQPHRSKTPVRTRATAISSPNPMRTCATRCSGQCRCPDTPARFSSTNLAYRELCRPRLCRLPSPNQDRNCPRQPHSDAAPIPPPGFRRGHPNAAMTQSEPLTTVVHFCRNGPQQRLTYPNSKETIRSPITLNKTCVCKWIAKTVRPT